MAHDVSEELRGFHGRWSKSADALKRMSKEAAAKPAPAGKATGTEAKIEGIEKGTTRRINGVAVHHISDSRVRVGFKKQGGGWDYQYYGSRGEAAKAVDAGSHHGEPVGRTESRAAGAAKVSAPRPGHALTGPPPTAHPMAPEPKPSKAPAGGGVKKGDRIVHDSGKTGIATADERNDVYGQGVRVVDVRWDAGQGRTRNTSVYARTVKKAEPHPGTSGVAPKDQTYAGMDLATLRARAKSDAAAREELAKRFGGGKPEAGLTPAQIRERDRPRPGAAHTRIMNRTSRRGGYKAEHLHNHTNEELYSARDAEKARLQSPTISWDATKDANKKVDQLEREMNRRGLDPRKPPASGVTEEQRAQIREMEAKAKAAHGPETPAVRNDLGTGSEFRSVQAQHERALATRERLTGGRIIPGPLAVQSNQREISNLESRMREMGARRKSGSNQWEMPPRPGTPAHAAEQLKNDISSITEQLHSQHEEAGAPLYSPEELIAARIEDVKRQLQSGQKTIVVKVPSGSEIQMRPETARSLMSQQQQQYLRRAQQQSRMAGAAARRGITNRGRPT